MRKPLAAAACVPRDKKGASENGCREPDQISRLLQFPTPVFGGRQPPCSWHYSPLSTFRILDLSDRLPGCCVPEYHCRLRIIAGCGDDLPAWGKGHALYVGLET